MLSRREDPAIAVVGAGISGLVAAHSLHACGLPVTVFDKARGAGGRTSTRRHRASSSDHGQTKAYAFDHGAQYFTARDLSFRRYVDSWVHDGVVARWGGTIAAIEDRRVELEQSGPERFVGVPGMSAVAGDLASDLDVVYKTRVGEIQRNNGHWQLVSDDNALLGDFDAVVVSTPPAQVAPLLTGAPALERRVRDVALSPCWAVMAVFNRRLDLAFDGAFVRASPLSWIARNGSKPGRSDDECWVLHASPEWSARNLEAKPANVERELLEAFFQSTGLESCQPLFTRAHRWRYSLAKDPLDEGCLWDADQRIGACGDWCNGSRVEGAFLSGLAIAGRVLETF